MRVYLGLCVLMLAGAAWADSDAALHAIRARLWTDMAQYQKAIEEYEQAYQGKAKPSYLYWTAQNYEGLADMPAKSAAEVLTAKQQALVIYERFVEIAAPEQPELEVARGRIEALRAELKELRTKRAMEQDEQLSWFRRIDEKLQVVIDLLRQERLAPRTQQKQTALQPQ